MAFGTAINVLFMEVSSLFVCVLIEMIHTGPSQHINMYIFATIRHRCIGMHTFYRQYGDGCCI